MPCRWISVPLRRSSMPRRWTSAPLQESSMPHPGSFYYCHPPSHKFKARWPPSQEIKAYRPQSQEIQLCRPSPTPHLTPQLHHLQHKLQCSHFPIQNSVQLNNFPSYQMLQSCWSQSQHKLQSSRFQYKLQPSCTHYNTQSSRSQHWPQHHRPTLLHKPWSSWLQHKLQFYRVFGHRIQLCRFLSDKAQLYRLPLLQHKVQQCLPSR